MSLNRAAQLAHNMRANAEQAGDAQKAELAMFLKELAEGLDRDMTDIKQSLRQLQDQTRNLR